MKVISFILVILFFEKVHCIPSSFLKSMEYILYNDVNTTTFATVASTDYSTISPTSASTADTAYTVTTTAALTTPAMSASCSMASKDYEWIDNLIQFIIERVIRLIILVIKKFIFKQPVNFSDFI